MERACIGLISDTHGLVRPQALVALEGVDLILHAGDVCGEGIVEELAAIAPTVAVVQQDAHARHDQKAVWRQRRVAAGGARRRDPGGGPLRAA